MPSPSLKAHLGKDYRLAKLSSSPKSHGAERQVLDYDLLSLFMDLQLRNPLIPEGSAFHHSLHE
jgi:hypothetical protein